MLVALLVESLKEMKERKRKKTVLQKSASYPLGTVVLMFLVSLAFPSVLAPRDPSPPGPQSPWDPSPPRALAPLSLSLA